MVKSFKESLARATKFCMWFYLVGFHQECINYSPSVEVDSSAAFRSFTWAYILKSLVILLLLLIRTSGYQCSPVARILYSITTGKVFECSIMDLLGPELSEFFECLAYRDSTY